MGTPTVNPLLNTVHQKPQLITGGIVGTSGLVSPPPSALPPLHPHLSPSAVNELLLLSLENLDSVVTRLALAQTGLNSQLSYGQSALAETNLQLVEKQFSILKLITSLFPESLRVLPLNNLAQIDERSLNLATQALAATERGSLGQALGQIERALEQTVAKFIDVASREIQGLRNLAEVSLPLPFPSNSWMPVLTSQVHALGDTLRSELLHLKAYLNRFFKEAVRRQEIFERRTAAPRKGTVSIPEHILQILARIIARVFYR